MIWTAGDVDRRDPQHEYTQQQMEYETVTLLRSYVLRSILSPPVSHISRDCWLIFRTPRLRRKLGWCLITHDCDPIYLIDWGLPPPERLKQV